jgi:hypothetical protein
MALKSCLLYMSCLLLGFSPNSAPFGTSPPPSPAKKPNSSSVSVPLTNSEIEQLHRNKRALSDYARKVFGPKK